EMLSMPAIERNGSFQNSYGNIRGQGDYKGVRVADLIELVGGMTEEQIVTVRAIDGYCQNFTYSNVYPNESQYQYQGDMVLAYQYNGTLIPDYQDGPRLMFLPEDGYFSNDDANRTIDPQFFTGAAGPKLVSRVAKIIVAERPQPEPKILFVTRGETQLSYSLTEIMQMPSISGLGGYKKSSGTIVGPFNYTGVTMQHILSLTGEPLVNYSIEVIATDNYTTYYNMTQIEGHLLSYNATTGESAGVQNCTLIIAYRQDGMPISDGGPLRIAVLNADGYVTDGHLWAKYVIRIRVIDTVVPWSLQLKGVEQWNMTYDIYYSLASCPHHRVEIVVDQHRYWGVPLWIIVASMDGGDDTHYTFNISLAIDGYNVTIYNYNAGVFIDSFRKGVMNFSHFLKAAPTCHIFYLSKNYKTMTGKQRELAMPR
ncbi:MAG: hypothetical protein QW286_01280, partial [Candidatus Aenigmatarchaeota archaeon]